MAATTGIEVARLQVDLTSRQEELRYQEEGWSHELADLRASQEAILVDFGKTDFQIEASQHQFLGPARP